ncbi:hypothetical protein [Micromonospora sp. SL4-19]|uniref:hypothetical protein n=1 Tax=Micromonospora sp. SL4-19 TaxID=3399129 RepID=UPI003A4DC20E
MPETTRHWPSHDAVLPDDVTDTLLWRVAYDVAEAHRPDAAGRCPSPLCGYQSAPCPPLVHARRAMRLARMPQSTPAPAGWAWRPEAA